MNAVMLMSGLVGSAFTGAGIAITIPHLIELWLHRHHTPMELVYVHSAWVAVGGLLAIAGALFWLVMMLAAGSHRGGTAGQRDPGRAR